MVQKQVMQTWCMTQAMQTWRINWVMHMVHELGDADVSVRPPPVTHDTCTQPKCKREAGTCYLTVQLIRAHLAVEEDVSHLAI